MPLELETSNRSQLSVDLGSGGIRHLRRKRVLRRLTICVVLVSTVLIASFLLLRLVQPESSGYSGSLLLRWTSDYGVLVAHDKAPGARGTECLESSDRLLCRSSPASPPLLKLGSWSEGQAMVWSGAFAFVNHQMTSLVVVNASCSDFRGDMCSMLVVSLHGDAGAVCIQDLAGNTQKRDEVCKKFFASGRSYDARWRLNASDGIETGFFGDRLVFGGPGFPLQSAFEDRAGDGVLEDAGENTPAREGPNGTNHVWVEVALNATRVIGPAKSSDLPWQSSLYFSLASI